MYIIYIIYLYYTVHIISIYIVKNIETNKMAAKHLQIGRCKQTFSRPQTWTSTSSHASGYCAVYSIGHVSPQHCMFTKLRTETLLEQSERASNERHHAVEFHISQHRLQWSFTEDLTAVSLCTGMDSMPQRISYRSGQKHEGSYDSFKIEPLFGKFIKFEYLFEYPCWALNQLQDICCLVDGTCMQENISSLKQIAQAFPHKVSASSSE